MSGWNQDDDARVAASELSINQNQFRTPLLLIRLANALVTVLPCPGGCLVGIVCRSACLLARSLAYLTRTHGMREDDAGLERSFVLFEYQYLTAD